MAEQKPVPITESEYRIIEQAVRRSPQAKNLSDEQVQDLILQEVQRTVESRQSTVGPGARPFSKQIFDAFVPNGKPQRILTVEEAQQVMAQAEASAPPGLSVQELMNLKVRAVEQAAYEGTPTGPTMRALQKLEPVVTPLLPENPVDLLDWLPGNMKQTYRANQQEMIAQMHRNVAAAGLPESVAEFGTRLLLRDRPYPPTPGDVLPILDPYNLLRMHSDPATLVTSGLPMIKGLRALFKGGKAAKVTGEMSQMPTAAELREVHGLGPAVKGQRKPRPAIVYRAPQRPPRPDVPWETGPEDLRQAAEAAEAEARRRADVPWETTQDLGQAAEEAEAAVRARDVPWQGGPEDLGRAADEAEATVRARDVPWGARTAPEGPPAGQGVGGATVPLPETPAPLRGAPEVAVEGAEALPEGIEEVIKTRTRPGAPGRPDPDRPEIKAIADDLAAGRITPEQAESAAAEVMRRVGGFNERGARLPEISKAEGDRLGARMDAIVAARKSGSEAASRQAAFTEPRTYTDPDDLTMGMDFGLGRALDNITPVKVGAIGGGSLGGLYGATQNEENPALGMAVGTVAGATGGAILGQLPAEARLLKADPFGWYDKMRRAGYLVGWAVPKSAAGAVTAPGWALAEQTFAGHPIEATKNMIRGLQSIPKGAEEAMKVVQTGHAPAYAEMAATHAPPAEGLASIPGRTMGVFDAFGRQALLHMKNPTTGVNYTPEEAAAFLLSGGGRTKAGRGTLDILAGRTGSENANIAGRGFKHLAVPVGGGTTVNSIEQGLQRLPFGLNLGTELVARKVPGLEGLKQTGPELFANTALGTGAFLAGEEAENQLDPESAQARRVAQAFFGKYGLPFSFGMGWQRNKELDEERRRSPWEVLGETTFQEAAGPPFRRNPLTEYIESTPPGRIWEGLFTPKY